VGLGVVAGAGLIIAVVAYQTALGYEVQAESGTTLSILKHYRRPSPLNRREMIASE
jgi:hypothetical protein